MMGNQRQVLKDNIEKELVAKIETAKDVLTQLNKSLETNKQNASSAKEEIRTTSDAMKDVLVQRKNELIEEVDNLYSIQKRSLQDAMKSTYITMGRLQSMLTNLDYFDQSQLVDLQIPQLDTSYALTEPTQINVAVECDQLKEELREWGNTSTDGFQCCMMDAAALSFPPDFSTNEICTPAFELLSTTADKENQKVQPTKITALCESCPWSSWGIENWLSGNSPRKTSTAESDKEDFLMVPSSPLSETSDMEFIVTVPDIEESSANLNHCRANCNEDSGKSSVCVKKDTTVENSDLSVWLKPRKSFKSSSLVPIQASSLSAVMLSSDASKFLITGKRNVASTEKRTLEFPCLNLDADTWIHKKKPKSSSSTTSSGKTCSFLLREQKLIPPAYALPNPFWLKKYQHKR